MYTFTAHVASKSEAESTVTLSLPGDTKMGIPTDPARWERQDDRIIATYTREELKIAVGLALEQRRAKLEIRLERGLEVLTQATGCEDANELEQSTTERLLAHWDALGAEYDATVKKLAEVMRDE